MISNSVANYYRKKELLPEQTIVCMEYAMQAFENELSKFVMFAIAFGVAGLLKEFYLTYVVLVSVRVFTAKRIGAALLSVLLCYCFVW